MAEVGSAFVSILPSAKGFGSKLDSQVGGEIKSSGGRMGKVFSGAMKVGLLAAGAGLVAVGGAFTGAIKAAAESEKITAQTAAVLKSTGGAANVTAKDVKNLGNEVSAYSGIADESVREGQNMLLTFTKVRNEVGKGNDVFTQATKLTTDMSVALGTDMKGAALQVGKALNDPTKGVTALSRAGVSFTQQQKDQIKAMQESGDMLGAQKLILGELETQFGGAAKAAGDTFTGSINKLKNAFGDTLRDAVAPLLPKLTEFALILAAKLPGALNAVIGGFKSVVNIVRPFAALIPPLVAGVRSLFTSMTSGSQQSSSAMGKALGGIMTAFRSLFAAVAPIIRSIVALIRANWGPISAFARAHFGAVRKIVVDVMRVVARVVSVTAKVISALWSRYGKDILKITVTVFKTIGGVVSGAMKVIGGIVKLVLSVLKGDWKGAWKAIQQIASGAWKVITSLVKGAMGVLKTVVVAGMRLVKDAAVAGFGKVVDTAKALPGKIKSGLGSLGDTLRSAGADLIRGMIAGIGDMAGAIAQKAKDVVGGAVSAAKKALKISSPSKVFREIGQQTGEGMALGLEDMGGRVVKASDALIPRPRIALDSTYASSAAGARGAQIVQNFPTTATPEAAAAAAGGRTLAALAAVGV